LNSYAAIILAAGYSSRMEQFKPLLTIDGQTIADRVISLFTKSDIDVILVTGWRRSELIDGIQNRQIKIVDNPDYPLGMLSSVKAGVRKLGRGHRAFFVMPLDIPLVRPFTIQRILKQAGDKPECVIVPSFNQIRGHPPLIPSRLISSIIDWNEPGGLKSYLKTKSELALDLPVPDHFILQDVDDAAAYAGLLKDYERREVPDAEECRIIIDELCHVPNEIKNHCSKVAEIGERIGRALIQSGQAIDLDLIRSSALLHDIAKGSPQHDRLVGKLLADMGFAKAAAVVSVHTDLPGKLADVSLETKVVYMADKFVQGENLVLVEDRFQASEDRYGSTPEVALKISQRRRQAFEVKLELENILRFSLDHSFFGKR
jgi:molybdenum cofactor cytidylyltransferase